MEDQGASPPMLIWGGEGDFSIKLEDWGRSLDVPRSMGVSIFGVATIATSMKKMYPFLSFFFSPIVSLRARLLIL